MHKHFKVVSGLEQSLSAYCPIDLFSCEETLVQNALGALTQTPQNNLRLFVQGVQQPITKEAMEQCLSKNESVRTQPAGTGTEDEGVALSVTLMDVLTRILVESPLLRRLGPLQSALDSLDIETVHQLYAQLVDPVTNTFPEPTLEEFLNTAQAFMNRKDTLDNRVDLETISRDDKLHFIREFLLSATLKDCSILITVQRVDNAEKTFETKAGSATLEETNRYEILRGVLFADEPQPIGPGRVLTDIPQPHVLIDRMV